jgi:hypothetical protein
MLYLTDEISFLLNFDFYTETDIKFRYQIASKIHIRSHRSTPDSESFEAVDIEAIGRVSNTVC